MRCRLVLACFGVAVAVGVVAELSQDPGGEDRTQAWLAGVDLSVRVLAKMCGHHRAQLVDLGVQRGDDGDLASHHGRIGGLDSGWLSKLVFAQDRGQLGGLGLDVATVGPTERGDDSRLGQPGRLIGAGCPGEQLERVGGVQVAESL